MSRYFAIIDCGTNTFSLTVFDVDKKGDFQCVEKQRHFVELGEAGLAYIGPASFERGVAAFTAFKEVVQRYPGVQIRAIGTAALRVAQNGLQFQEEAHRASNIDIEIINGQREAQLIYQGVYMTNQLRETPALIIDIGGGSVEFIIASKREVYWSHSLPVGMAVLHKLVGNSIQLTEKMEALLYRFLEKELEPLYKKLKALNIRRIIGAAGCFKVYRELLECKKNIACLEPIQAAHFNLLYKEIVFAPYKERLDILSPTRAKLLGMSMVIIQHIFKNSAIEEIEVSKYAIKEGVLSEMLNRPIPLSLGF